MPGAAARPGGSAAQKNAVATAVVKKGKGLVKVNGSPIEIVEPALLRMKTFEPIMLIGQDKFAGVDVRVRVTGGGYTSQIYGALRARARAVGRLCDAPRSRARRNSDPAGDREGHRRIQPEV